MNIIPSTLCYIKKDGKTLMLHRNKRDDDMHEGKWNGLGGKFLPGETPEECVIREVKEESGLSIENPLLRGVLTFPDFNETENWLVFVYLATEFQGELIESSEGELSWVSDSELFDLNLWEGDHYFIKWLDRSQFFSGKFVYDGKKLKDHSVQFY